MFFVLLHFLLIFTCALREETKHRDTIAASFSRFDPQSEIVKSASRPITQRGNVRHREGPVPRTIDQSEVLRATLAIWSITMATRLGKGIDLLIHSHTNYCVKNREKSFLIISFFFLHLHNILYVHTHRTCIQFLISFVSVVAL